MDVLLNRTISGASVLMQLGQLFGVQRVHPEAAAFIFGQGQLRRLKDEQVRFLYAGGKCQVAW